MFLFIPSYQQIYYLTFLILGFQTVVFILINIVEVSSLFSIYNGLFR